MWPSTTVIKQEPIDHDQNELSARTRPLSGDWLSLRRTRINQNQTRKPPTEAVYQLDWSIRDEIIFSLNRYTQLLHRERPEIELAKEEMLYKSLDLYQALITLTPKSKSKSKTNTVPSESSGEAKSLKQKVFLDLNLNTRFQIFSALYANQALVVDGELASEENKLKTVQMNNELVVKLMNLPISTLADESSSNGKLIKPKGCWKDS